MSKEWNIRGSAILKKGTLYEPVTFGYTLDMVGSLGGPTPGEVIVPTTGIDVDLSVLDTPGVCLMTNLDSTNYVEVGVHDGSVFHPVMELPPGGKPILVPLSRNLGVEEDLPGSGTTPIINTLMLRANIATCKVVIKAYER